MDKDQILVDELWEILSQSDNLEEDHDKVMDVIYKWKKESEAGDE